PFTEEEIRRGPRTIAGPDTTGDWVIFKVKSKGMAPGFWIKDAQGNRFIIKPEIKGFPEVGTSAENITTLLYHAAGYHTPENYLTQVRPDRVKIKSGVKLVDDRGVKRFMTQDDLDKIFERTHMREDGSVRAIASRFIKGVPVGSFRFTGTRQGDPNDLVPHQHRRELRALYILCSWLNHHDLNSGNFFESYITRDGKSYIGHYLLDFSSTLGASLFGAQPRVRGYTPLVNPIYTLVINPLRNWFFVPRWESRNPITNSTVGRFNNGIFKPDRFKVNYPLAAFSLMTDRDAYWGAKMVMSFTDAQIRSVVKEGHYSDPEAGEILAGILIERRDMIGRFWYDRVVPLEHFTYDEGQGNMCFTDMALSGNLAKPGDTEYLYRVKHNGAPMGKKWRRAETTCLDVPKPENGSHSLDEIEVTIKTSRKGWKNKSCMKVYVQSRNRNSYQVVGLKR
ncbi:hypothetical protein ACFL5V_12870, partial [Fibrobacterota bacterium]